MTRTHPMTDHQVQSAIVKKLDWSAEVLSEHVGVAVTDGAVTLSGEVATATERIAAIRAATDVSGVAVVVDELVVCDPQHLDHDADITRTVQAVLDADDGLVRGVIATVHHRDVVLSGTVDANEQRRALYAAVRAVPGVRSVVHELDVRPVPTPDEVKAHVVDALSRGVQRETDHIRVEVNGHVTTLHGCVHSWYERRAAEQAAGEVPGVTRVDNQLVIAS